MALRPTPHPTPAAPPSRHLARGLATIAALAGLGGAFLLGTSYAAGGRGVVTGPGPTAVAHVDAELSPTGSCEELLDHYVDRAVELVGPYGWGAGTLYDVVDVQAGDDGAVALPESAAGSAARDAAPAAPAPVRATNGETGTNVQEAGVDEPDVVKTGGGTLFRVEDGDLVAYDVSGAEVERLASLDLPGAGSSDVTEILLSGSTLVAVVQVGSGGPGATTDPTTSATAATTTIVAVDVSDPAAPAVTRTAEYAAGLVAARSHDGVVRLVLGSGLPELDFATPDRTTTEHEAHEANREAVRASTLADWLPTVAYDAGGPAPLLECGDVAVPDHDSPLGTVAVVGFEAATPESPSVTGLAVDSDLAYASADQLYLATTPAFPGVWSGVVRCGDCLQPVPVPDGAVLDPGGLAGRLGSWLSDVDGAGTPPADAASHVYAFDLEGTDTTYAASGAVDGTIRDRWSMDAAGGVLRVAVGPDWSGRAANSVVTYRQEGDDLVEAGRLDGLGVGEQITAVRWFDTLAIVVTFRQVDPLYAVDLSDPADPELMGELKIPGFSAYLHPLGEERLLGLGEGPARGGAWGAQAGLFDVSDLADPRRLDVVSFGAGSRALAGEDPRQVTWLPDRRTVLTVVADQLGGADVAVLTLGDGELGDRLVEVDHGDEITEVRLVPVPDGRVVLVTADDAAFFAV